MWLKDFSVGGINLKPMLTVIEILLAWINFRECGHFTALLSKFLVLSYSNKVSHILKLKPSVFFSFICRIGYIHMSLKMKGKLISMTLWQSSWSALPSDTSDRRPCFCESKFKFLKHLSVYSYSSKQCTSRHYSNCHLFILLPESLGDTQTHLYHRWHYRFWSFPLR